MEMDTSCRTQATRKAYKLLSWCVMLTLNTDVFKLILLLLKEKDIVTIPQIPYTFSDVDLPAELFQGRFMHTIFSAKGFVPPTHIVNTVTSATEHSRNK